ncbi:MAG: DUF6273 domain-containing protein, partial [Lachnospiraceae bacterium]|nr:DUF6273 domain-containing protein [Lachnospiraceae bacterium]
LPNLMVDNSAEYVLNTIDGYSGEEKEAGYTFTMPANEKSISVTTRRYAFEEGKTYFRYKLRGEDYAKWNYSGCLCLWKDYNATQTSKKTTVVTGGDDTSWYFLSCADDNGPVVPGDVCTFGGTGRLTAYYGGSDADNYLSNEFLLSMSPKLKDILANTPFAVYKAAIPETGAQDSVPKATIDSGLYGQDDTILSDSSSGTTSYTGVYTRKVFLPSYIEINTYSPEKLTGLRSVWENEESGPRKGWWTRVVTKDLYTNAWNRLCTGVWAYNLKTSFTQIGLRPAFCIPNG